MEDMNKGKITAVVLSGGKGLRMGGPVRKQYLSLGGKPLLVHSLEAFERSSVDEIVLVTGSEDIGYVSEEIVKPYHIHKVRQIVPGGKERYHSVYEGLKAAGNCSLVLIHDGARPLVTEAVIERAVDGARMWRACVVGMPVKDTIKVADQDGLAASTPDRRYLWQVQTPQAFSYELIKAAYDKLLGDERLQEGITDDAMVVEHHTDVKVKLIEGSYENIKVTTPEDLRIAEALLDSRNEGTLKKTE